MMKLTNFRFGLIAGMTAAIALTAGAMISSTAEAAVLPLVSQLDNGSPAQEIHQPATTDAAGIPAMVVR